MKEFLILLGQPSSPVSNGLLNFLGVTGVTKHLGHLWSNFKYMVFTHIRMLTSHLRILADIAMILYN